MSPAQLEIENSPNQIGLLHTEVIYTSGQIHESLEVLLNNNEITLFQYNQLQKAVLISERVYTLNPRRDQFRNHAVGHVFPIIGNIIKNKERVIEIVKEETAEFKLNSADIGATMEQKALYVSLLVTFGHDWYEDYMGNESRDVLKEKVKKEFGEDIHNLIEILTKPDKGIYPDIIRDQVYYDKLTSSNSKLVALIKLLDRNSNHNDDFGVHDFAKVKSYCDDTEQNLIVWFKNILTGPGEVFVREFIEAVGNLKDDASDSEVLSDATSSIVSRFLRYKRSDNTTWLDHTDRMIDMIKSLGLRKTLGKTIAIRMHDLFDLDGDMVVVDPRIKEELDQLFKISPEKAAYSIGIAMGAKKLEAIMTGYLRNVDLSYHTQDEEVRDRLRQIYSPDSKVHMSFNELGEMVNYEPVIATEVMREMSEWDIESLLVVVLERLDNLEHPVLYGSPYDPSEHKKKDALYQWKTAQELLFLHPLLEIGGFKDLATKVRGRAFEFLLQGNAMSKEAREFHRMNAKFFGKYKKMILLDLLEVKQKNRFVFRYREKEEGSTTKKMFDLERKGKPTEVGDFLSVRFIYDDELSPYNLGSIIEIANQLINKIQASFRNLHGGKPEDLEHIKVEIENPRSDRKPRGIYISTSNTELIEEGERLIESLKNKLGARVEGEMKVLDIDDVNEEEPNENTIDADLPSIMHDKVDLNRIIFDDDVTLSDFESSQFYMKISGIPGFPEPIYIEVQLVSKESYKRGIIGTAAHHIYKINLGLEKMEKEDSTEEDKAKLINVSAFDQKVLLELYKRFAAYRSSYRAHLFLSPPGTDQLKYVFEDVLVTFKDVLPNLDFNGSINNEGLGGNTDDALVNHILPYIS